MRHQSEPTVTVRDLRVDDLASVRQVVERRVRDPATGQVLSGEVEEILDGMRRTLEGGRPGQFLVAVAVEAGIVGVLGMRPLSRPMAAFSQGRRPVEMVHAFVTVEAAGTGIGSALVAALEERARLEGHDEILLNSGPRYAASGWGFFDRLAGYERRGVLGDLYGPGQDAPVWSKHL